MSSVYRTPDFLTPPWGMFFLLLIVGVAIAGVGNKITQSGEKERQKDDDAVARQIVARVSIGDPPHYDFALYLRPFSIDGTIINPRDGQNLFDLDQHYRPGDDTLERLLADALRRTYKTVALGIPDGEISGVGQAGLLDNWQTRVGLLMERANLIFVCPSDEPGVVWEMREIVTKNLWDKVVFLMPWYTHGIVNPLFPAIESSSKSTTDEYAKQWDVMRVNYRKNFSVNIPAYDQSGGVFRFTDQNEICVFRKFTSRVTPVALVRATNSIMEK